MSASAPQWISDAVIYEVFVRNHGTRGGFAAVQEDLARIRSLGTDIVWLMPIHPIGTRNRNGNLGSPYAIQDYRAINSELGTRDDLEALVGACHALGMKIIMDVVFNHTSPDSILARHHPEWFLRNESGNPIPKFPEWADIVDLSFFSPREGERNEGLWEYLIETLEQWAAAGMDGFRCDVASLVPVEFWRLARQRVEASVGGRRMVWLAETSHKHFLKYMRDRGYSAWADAEILSVFDISYDHDGVEYLDEYFAGNRELGAYLDHLLVQETMNPAGSLKLRFAENHDQPRAAEKIRGIERLKAWTAFHAFLPGIFLIYAGQEYGLKHRPDLFDKDPIDLPIGGDLQPQSFAAFLRDLIATAKTVKRVCRYFLCHETRKGVVCLVWSDKILDRSMTVASPLRIDETRITVLLNLEDRFGEMDIGRTIQGTNLLTGDAGPIGPVLEIPRVPVVIREQETLSIANQDVHHEKIR